MEDATWILLDFGIFVVHVFHEETRSFYDIERLWSDVPKFRFDADGKPTS
jgi:ribosome-associated protein